MLFSEDADDDFLNMIESALQSPEIPGQDEVSSPYQEGLDDGNVQVSREGQTDDSISSSYGENSSEAVSSEEDASGTEVSGTENAQAPDSAQIVQSIYGVAEKASSDDEYGDDVSSIQVKIPSKIKPKPADSEKLAAAKKRDEDGKDFAEKKETLALGTPSEISSVVDKIVDDDDPRYIDILYELFYKTSSNDVRSKIIDYFAKNEDPCLSDYVVEILDDPYDTSNSFVSKCMEYASKVKCTEAAPAFVKMLESEKEEYFNSALSALGKTGGKKEAKYLAKYLERDTPPISGLTITKSSFVIFNLF